MSKTKKLCPGHLFALVNVAALKIGLDLQASEGDSKWDALAKGDRIIVGMYEVDPKECGPLGAAFKAITIKVSVRVISHEMESGTKQVLSITFDHAWTLQSGGTNGESVYAKFDL